MKRILIVTDAWYPQVNGVVRAILASAVFFATGIFFFFTQPLTTSSILLFLYYIVLLINTFLSIRAFATITPTSAAQSLFDGTLALIYLLLALSFSSVLLFSSISFTLFVIAICKYIHMLKQVPSYHAFVIRKIQINGLSVLLSVIAGMLAYFGYPSVAAWTLCTSFLLANIYLLIVNPMYRLEHRVKTGE